MKITMVGGGSYAWTPGLVQNFMANEFFKDVEICLYDLNEAALKDLLSFCTLYQDTFKKSKMKFVTTTNLKEALSGASYVIVAISNGGLEAELEDHRIARKYGFYNIKGSEVGIAGCSRTLRHVPVFVKIAREMEKICPNAMLINVTNPLTSITRSVNKYTSIKSAGFCHGVGNHLECLFPLIGIDGWDGVEYTVAGVDHCSWQLAVSYKGKDVLQILKDKGLIEAARAGHHIAAYEDPFAGVENQRLRFILWDIIGYLPSLSDEHCAEFFGQFLKDKETREYYDVTYDRIYERTKTVDRDRTRVIDILEGKEAPVFSPSNEIIDQFIAALNGAGVLVDTINYPNEGQVANLPMDTVVETRCLVDSNGVHPIIAGALPPILESIVRPVAIREELYMEAAMENNFNKLRGALSTDPLVNEFRNIDELAKELLEYNAQFNR